jgi:hypothetical protein
MCGPKYDLHFVLYYRTLVFFYADFLDALACLKAIICMQGDFKVLVGKGQSVILGLNFFK